MVSIYHLFCNATLESSHKKVYHYLYHNKSSLSRVPTTSVKHIQRRDTIADRLSHNLHLTMLFKAIVLEALVAAAAVNAQETSITPVEVAVNAKHTPLSQCPGRSKVYVALSKYSAPASFCSTFMSLNGGTQTITKTQSNAAPVTTT